MARNLAPAPFLLLPFTLLVSSLMQDDLSRSRLGWWILASVAATGVTLLGLYRYFMVVDGQSTPRSTQFLIGFAFVSLGLYFGMCPVSYTHLRAHETVLDLVCRLLLEKKQQIQQSKDAALIHNSKETVEPHTKP